MEVVIINGSKESGCRQLANQLRIAGYVHFDPDMLFIDDCGNYGFIEHRAALAYDWCIREVKKAVSKNKRVVVSGDFSQLEDLQPYRDLPCNVEVLGGDQAASYATIQFIRSRVEVKRNYLAPLFRAIFG